MKRAVWARARAEERVEMRRVRGWVAVELVARGTVGGGGLEGVRVVGSVDMLGRVMLLWRGDWKWGEGFI